MAKKRKTSDLILGAEETERQRNTRQAMAKYRKDEAAMFKAYGLFYPNTPSADDGRGNVMVNPQRKTAGGAGGRTLASPTALRKDAENRVGKTKRRK